MSGWRFQPSAPVVCLPCQHDVCNRCAGGCDCTHAPVTAAPGPQQPDEVQPRMSIELYAILRAAATDLGLVHGRSDLGRELRTLIDRHGATRPAAPSTQPERLACDVCGKTSTWTSTPGGIRLCDNHGTRR